MCSVRVEIISIFVHYFLCLVSAWLIIYPSFYHFKDETFLRVYINTFVKNCFPFTDCYMSESIKNKIFQKYSSLSCGSVSVSFLYIIEMKPLLFSFDNKCLHQILVGRILNLEHIM